MLPSTAMIIYNSRLRLRHDDVSRYLSPPNDCSVQLCDSAASSTVVAQQWAAVTHVHSARRPNAGAAVVSWSELEVNILYTPSYSAPRNVAQSVAAVAVECPVNKSSGIEILVALKVSPS